MPALAKKKKKKKKKHAGRATACNSFNTQMQLKRMPIMAIIASRPFANSALLNGDDSLVKFLRQRDSSETKLFLITTQAQLLGLLGRVAGSEHLEAEVSRVGRGARLLGLGCLAVNRSSEAHRQSVQKAHPEPIGPQGFNSCYGPNSPWPRSRPCTEGSGPSRPVGPLRLQRVFMGACGILGPFEVLPGFRLLASRGVQVTQGTPSKPPLPQQNCVDRKAL